MQPVPGRPLLSNTHSSRDAGTVAIGTSGKQQAAPTQLELPVDRSHLNRFFDKLSALKKGTGKRARIAFWGDSHVAGEMLPGRLRSRLQETFGDAGPGFVLLGQPWRSYRHLSVKLGANKRWRAERIWARYSRKRPQPRDDLFGLAGISVNARRSGRTWVEPRGRRTLASLDLYYLRQPGGGKLEIRAGGRRVKLLLTVASRKEPAYARVKLPPRTRRVELVTGRVGEVRLFGADLESGVPGVVLDTFGINGARAGTVLKWNERLMVHQLGQLAPDLVVLAYGSNEVDSDNLTRQSFGATFDALLTRMRKAAPSSACLVVGPPDQGRFDKELGWQIPGRLDWLVAEQRRLARRRGCAFWDQRAAMGGARGIYNWVRADPPLARPDHVHLSVQGYRAIGDALADALLAAWHKRRCAGGQAACRVSDAGVDQ
jgi:lysophospholipase L1-like esterase